jgi:phosphoglycolate phosphatase
VKHSFHTLIFDLDGTLIDSASDVIDSVYFALGEMGAPLIRREAIKKVIGPGRDAFFKAVFPDGRKKEFNRFISIFREYYWEHCLDQTTLFPGVSQVLSKIKDQKLAIASNKPKLFIEKILTGLHIRDRFHCVVGPEDVRQAKPDPEMIDKILDLCDGLSLKTLLIGDTDKDMMAGRAAGVRVCGVRYGYGDEHDLESQNPDFMVDQAEELISIIGNHHV